MFLYQDFTSHNNFPGDLTNSSMDIASIFFQKRYFESVKINRKNSYGFWKNNKFIWNEKKNRLPDYLLNN